MEKKKKMPKLLRIVLIVLAIIIVVPLVAVFAIWHNEISTVCSIKQLNVADPSHEDGAVYTMTVSGDYYFDKFIEQGGVSSDKELINFITNNITKGLLKMNIEESEIACSSFTSATPDGDRLFARNYDFKQTNTCIVYTKPGHGRHSSVSTVDLEFISIKNDKGIQGLNDKILCLAAPFVPLDGVNDAGVSCGIYMSYQGKETVATAQDTEKPDLTSTTMLRMVLDYADSVDEAVELIEKYDLHDSANTSYHYMIADASGKSAILEWVPEVGTDSTDNDGSRRKLVVTYNDGAPYQVVTNYIIAPGYYDGEPEDEMKGYDRLLTLTDKMENCKGVVADEAEAMDILSLVGRRGMREPGSNSTSITVHSVIYNLTDHTALWIGNEHYGEKDYTFELKVK